MSWSRSRYFLVSILSWCQLVPSWLKHSGDIRLRRSITLAGKLFSLSVFAHHTLNCHYLTKPQTNRHKFDVVLQSEEGSAVAPPTSPRCSSPEHLISPHTATATWPPGSTPSVHLGALCCWTAALIRNFSQTLDSAAAAEWGRGRGRRDGGEDEGEGRRQTKEAAVRTEMWRQEDMEFEDEPSVRVARGRVVFTTSRWVSRATGSRRRKSRKLFRAGRKWLMFLGGRRNRSARDTGEI